MPSSIPDEARMSDEAFKAWAKEQTTRDHPYSIHWSCPNDGCTWESYRSVSRPLAEIAPMLKLVTIFCVPLRNHEVAVATKLKNEETITHHILAANNRPSCWSRRTGTLPTPVEQWMFAVDSPVRDRCRDERCQQWWRSLDRKTKRAASAQPIT